MTKGTKSENHAQRFDCFVFIAEIRLNIIDQTNNHEVTMVVRSAFKKYSDGAKTILDMYLDIFDQFVRHPYV